MPASQYRAIYGELPIDADTTIADLARLGQGPGPAVECRRQRVQRVLVRRRRNERCVGRGGWSRTGGHHILGLAESMARGNAPLLVLTQACAHAAPTLGNEFKVVNWLRAAAIIARVDPVKAGYLASDSAGHLRLPALGGLAGIDLNAAGQVNFRLGMLHALSDADFTLSGPAVVSVTTILAAPEFDYDATVEPSFTLRNSRCCRGSAELFAVYGEGPRRCPPGAAAPAGPEGLLNAGPGGARCGLLRPTSPWPDP